MSRLVIFNKPYDVLCQFQDSENRATLADWISLKGVYAAGRLDRDSEGLVILTDDGQWQARISQPGDRKWEKEYWVQVEGKATDELCRQLSQGVMLKDGLTLPCLCKVIPEPDWIWDRNPPVRERQSIPTSWISIRLREGKNRQVRRMTASIGLPTLRLIRVSIGPYGLMGQGDYEGEQVVKLLPGELEVVHVETLIQKKRPKPPKNTSKRHGLGRQATARGKSRGAQYPSGKSSRSKRSD